MQGREFQAEALRLERAWPTYRSEKGRRIWNIVRSSGENEAREESRGQIIKPLKAVSRICPSQWETIKGFQTKDLNNLN